MRWNKSTLTTTTEAEDVVSSILMDLGIEGVQIEDSIPLSDSDKQQMFIDILPDAPTDDGIANISFYLAEDADTADILSKIETALEGLHPFLNVGDCTITRSLTEDADWLNNWKEYFKQFYVDDILIIPSWEQVKAEDRERLTIHIDPGTAFGTGMHETTQLCIRQMRKYITPQTRLLDVGTGSGILSIIALKCGIASALGTDLDPCALDAVRENMIANDIKEESFRVILGNIIDDRQVQENVGRNAYDIVTANILADVLIPLTPVVKEHLKPGGYFITSGIIDAKEAVVKQALTESGFEILQTATMGEWVGITAQKKEDTP